jgi:HEAT repeat protein
MFFLSLLACLAVHLPCDESFFAKKAQAFLTIHDPQSALEEIDKGLTFFPESPSLQNLKITSHAEMLDEEEMFKAFEKAEEVISRKEEVLESLGWAVLKKGFLSDQYNVKMAALIGSFLTRQTPAVFHLLEALRDTNAIIRALAVQLSCQYGDELLKKEIIAMYQREKNYMVRLEILKAVGKIQIHSMRGALEDLLSEKQLTQEEKATIIHSLVELYDQIDEQSLAKLFASDRGSLRRLACELVLHFQYKEAYSSIKKALYDKRFDVRISALNCLALLYKECYSDEEYEEILTPLLSDSHPLVSITATWALFQKKPQKCTQNFEKWIFCDNPIHRRIAASALASSGKNGILLIVKFIKRSSDPYVLGNLAIGLMRVRQKTELSCTIIHDLLSRNSGKWMWQNVGNPIFQVFSPSSLRYNEQIPGYPEAVDQLVRLDLIHYLALMGDVKAEEVARQFLKNRQWGISGAAAALLMKEGSAESLDIIRSLAKSDDDGIRMQAALILAFILKDDSARAILKAMYEKSSYEKKAYIIEALGYIGHKDDVPFLYRACKEPFSLLKITASSSLIRSINH